MLSQEQKLRDACDWDSMVQDSDGNLPPDVPADELLREYREARARAYWRKAVGLVALIGIVCAIVAAVVIGLLMAIVGTFIAHPGLWGVSLGVGIVGVIFAYLGATT